MTVFEGTVRNVLQHSQGLSVSFHTGLHGGADLRADGSGVITITKLRKAVKAITHEPNQTNQKHRRQHTQ